MPLKRLREKAASACSRTWPNAMNRWLDLPEHPSHLGLGGPSPPLPPPPRPPPRPPRPALLSLMAPSSRAAAPRAPGGRRGRLPEGLRHGAAQIARGKGLRGAIGPHAGLGARLKPIPIDRKALCNAGARALGPVVRQAGGFAGVGSCDGRPPAPGLGSLAPPRRATARRPQQRRSARPRASCTGPCWPGAARLDCACGRAARPCRRRWPRRRACARRMRGQRLPRPGDREGGGAGVQGAAAARAERVAGTTGAACRPHRRHGARRRTPQGRPPPAAGAL
jgi:hypothetical protein